MIFENVPRTYTEKWWKPLNYKTRSQLFSLPFDTLFPSKTVYIGYRKREDSSFLYSDLNLNVPSSKRTSSGSQWRRQWQPTPVLLPGKSHGWRSLVGCSPWGQKESDTTERLHFHFSLSCIGEGNGNPPQCSCLENPRDGGTWWAASMGSHRVGHDWSDLAAAAAAAGSQGSGIPHNTLSFLLHLPFKSN